MQLPLVSDYPFFQLNDGYGYHNIDALDPSEEMLHVARKAQLYKQYYCCRIGDGHVIPIPDSKYLQPINSIRLLI